ncbi:MAG TPA: LacI family transcriptional regulator, partial [Phycisphaerales bacterium]|nr:LacI family transcriptional regulator [Phycisphaerales bacterium]
SASALVTPPLTTVHVPLREMGQRAVRQLLVNVSYESNLSGSIIRMSPELVVRQSTARCPS